MARKHRKSSKGVRKRRSRPKAKRRGNAKYKQGGSIMANLYPYGIGGI